MTYQVLQLTGTCARAYLKTYELYQKGYFKPGLKIREGVYLVHMF